MALKNGCCAYDALLINLSCSEQGAYAIVTSWNMCNMCICEYPVLMSHFLTILLMATLFSHLTPFLRLLYGSYSIRM